MTDDRNGLVGHSPDGRRARAAIDGIGARLVDAEGPPHEIVGGAYLVELSPGIVKRFGAASR